MKGMKVKEKNRQKKAPSDGAGGPRAVGMAAIAKKKKKKNQTGNKKQE